MFLKKETNPELNILFFQKTNDMGDCSCKMNDARYSTGEGKQYYLAKEMNPLPGMSLSGNFQLYLNSLRSFASYPDM